MPDFQIKFIDGRSYRFSSDYAAPRDVAEAILSIGGFGDDEDFSWIIATGMISVTPLLPADGEDSSRNASPEAK